MSEMRTPLSFIAVLVVAMAVAGCSGLPMASALPGSSGAGSSTATAASPAAPPQPSAGSSTPSSTATSTAVDPATVAAIKSVIEKANQEQQDAFSKGDPTLMRDTATSDYYQEMVKVNSDLANAGVSAIKLLKLEWGEIKLTGQGTAQATTFETWETTYSDGSTDQAREQNVYTLVQESGAWKIKADDHPNSNPGLPPGPSVTSRSGTGTPPSASSSPTPGATVSPADLSRNWAGYAATSGTFTGVTGTWTVPESQGGAGFSGAATWVGIGGVHSRDLIQAGTMVTTDAAGNVQYQAWMETLPQAARPVRLAVKPGDSVTVSLNEQSTDLWLIRFENHTTGETYQTTVRYASSKSSAEWIEEAPSAGRRIVPIGDFGVVQFSGGTAVQNGRTVTIAESGAQPITMAGPNGSILASPSTLTPDGQGFTVTRSDAIAPTPSRSQGSGA